jgi:hypothetical protein
MIRAMTRIFFEELAPLEISAYVTVPTVRTADLPDSWVASAERHADQ